ncbi:MAG: helix-turn-helix domain-containing protein [Halanaerobiales bacterium]|nr:helix-turn-helix domain-containing protein [Halanaerobiales bacterium]
MSESKYTIDVQRAKEILGVSRKTIYNRLKSGELDGKKVATDNTMKWVINENDIKQAKRVQESVEVVEVEENISKEQLIESIQEAVNSQNKQVIQESMEKVTDKIDQQNKAIQQLTEQIKRLKEQQNKSLWDKAKNIFKQ